MFRSGYGWLPEKRCVRLRVKFHGYAAGAHGADGPTVDR